MNYEAGTFWVDVAIFVLLVIWMTHDRMQWYWKEKP